MPDQSIPVGTVGRSLTEMNPTGRVRIGDQTVFARSERMWIEAGTDVVVVRSDGFGLVVRVADGRPISEKSDVGGESSATEEELTAELDTGTDDERASEKTAYGRRRAFSSFKVELIAAILWTSIGSIFVVTGVSSWTTLWILPAGGALAGLIYRGFVMATWDSASPDMDARPLASAMATWMILGATLFVGAGVYAGCGAVGTTVCLVVGTTTGALWVMVMLMIAG